LTRDSATIVLPLALSIGNLETSKKSKLKLYCSITRPTVTYVCETWVLKGTTKNKLMVFERKVLRKIFGPTKERDST
jgi:hypothetical protein